MKNLTPSWTRITEKRGDNLKKAELNALAVRARDGSEETLLDLWNAVKGFVKKKAVKSWPGSIIGNRRGDLPASESWRQSVQRWPSAAIRPHLTRRETVRDEPAAAGFL